MKSMRNRKLEDLNKVPGIREMSDEEVDSQISKVFWSQDTQFVSELVIIRGDEIVRIARRL